MLEPPIHWPFTATGRAASEIVLQKFRKDGVPESIESNWDSISDAIVDVLDFVRGKTFIQCDKAIPSYLALIPIVYARTTSKITGSKCAMSTASSSAHCLQERSAAPRTS